MVTYIQVKKKKDCIRTPQGGKGLGGRGRAWVAGSGFRFPWAQARDLNCKTCTVGALGIHSRTGGPCWVEKD